MEFLSAQLLDPTASTSASRSDPDALDEEDIFAELEAEIENDDEWVREQGLKELRRECVQLSYGMLLWTPEQRLSLGLSM